MDIRFLARILQILLTLPVASGIDNSLQLFIITPSKAGYFFIRYLKTKCSSKDE
jgi:hypothetical protein